MNDNVLVKDKEMVEKEVRNERILVPICNDVQQMDSLYKLNETASFVWNRVKTGISEKQIISEMTDHYEVKYETASQDVKIIIENLIEMGLFVRQSN